MNSHWKDPTSTKAAVSLAELLSGIPEDATSGLLVQSLLSDAQAFAELPDADVTPDDIVTVFLTCATLKSKLARVLMANGADHGA